MAGVLYRRESGGIHDSQCGGNANFFVTCAQRLRTINVFKPIHSSAALVHWL